MKNKKNIIIIISIIVAFAIGLYFAFSIGYNSKQTSQFNAETSQFNPEFEENQTKEQAPTGSKKGVEIPGYTTIVIPSGKTDVEVDFFNPKENNVYFEIALILNDTQEEIYKSKLISPGQHLYNINLNKPLEKGNYDMTIKYSTYSLDEKYTPKNGAVVECVLEVQ